jgi:NadR type nicotinamide-nucleotide adenylyltransferase
MNASEKPRSKRVAVVGPECTGKSDLCSFLAEYYSTDWVPEYARGYLDNLVRPYGESDLLSIAHGQMRLEDTYGNAANKVIFCDTNLYVIKVWSEFKFKRCHPEIIQELNKRKYDLYLLTYIDVPWVDDPLREHPQQREELYSIYLQEMKNQATPFVEIRGDRELRRKTAIAAVDNVLSKN